MLAARCSRPWPIRVHERFECSRHTVAAGRTEPRQMSIGTNALAAATIVSFRDGERHPGELPLVLHEDSGELVFQGRLRPEHTQRLVRLRDRRILNLDDDVALLYS